MKIEARIKELGYQLPDTVKPQGAYCPCVMADGFVFTAGQTCRVDGKLQYTGKVGAELSLEDARKAAELCALNCLAILRQMVGDLDRVHQIVKMTGFVASDPNFMQQTQVIDGASELLREIFGERGVSARSAVGVCVLPGDAACEIELIAKI